MPLAAVTSRRLDKSSTSWKQPAMSEFENTPADPAPDTEMTGAEAAETTEVAETSGPAEGADAQQSAEASAELPFAEEQEEEEQARQTFADYLSSPVVSLLVGKLGEEKVLTAHQALLVKSPYFKDLCAGFADDGSVSSPYPLP